MRIRQRQLLICQQKKPSVKMMMSLPLNDVAVQLYDMQLGFAGMIESQLTSVSLGSAALLYSAGLLTSFSPCALSLLPLTLAYLGDANDSKNKNQEAEESVDASLSLSSTNVGLARKSAFYATGLATTLTLLGLATAFLGQMFGSTFSSSLGLSEGAINLFTGLLTITFGLNLLELVNLSFPSLDNLQVFKDTKISPSLEAFLFGISAALISSPCSSPVLASVLAVVATSGDPVLGSFFLFSYSIGYATPVVVAGAASGQANKFAKSEISLGGETSWVNNFLASALVCYGTYNVLSAVQYTLM